MQLPGLRDYLHLFTINIYIQIMCTIVGCGTVAVHKSVRHGKSEWVMHAIQDRKIFFFLRKCISHQIKYLHSTFYTAPTNYQENLSIQHFHIFEDTLTVTIYICYGTCVLTVMPCALNWWRYKCNLFIQINWKIQNNTPAISVHTTIKLFSCLFSCFRLGTQ